MLIEKVGQTSVILSSNTTKYYKLKKFLQDRGITVNSYLKPGLVAIACAVEEMNLPLQCQTTESEEQLNMSLRLLYINMTYR